MASEQLSPNESSIPKFELDPVFILVEADRDVRAVVERTPEADEAILTSLYRCARWINGENIDAKDGSNNIVEFNGGEALHLVLHSLSFLKNNSSLLDGRIMAIKSRGEDEEVTVINKLLGIRATSEELELIYLPNGEAKKIDISGLGRSIDVVFV